MTHQTYDVKCDPECCLVHINRCCWPQHLDTLNQLVDATQDKRVLLLDVLFTRYTQQVAKSAVGQVEGAVHFWVGKARIVKLVLA
jgi:hypothetical protein